MNRLQLTYHSNETYLDGDRRTPRFYASLDLSGYDVEERIDRLPIYYNELDEPAGTVKGKYNTCIAGLDLEKGDLGSLESTLDLYMGALIHFGRLPEYLFRVDDKAWPIYQLPDQLVTRYPGDPVLGASTIGQLRAALADYFKRMGLIRNRKNLGILKLSRHDLQLYSPVCFFRAEGIVDIPVFPIEKGQEVILNAPVNSTSIDFSFDNGQGILKLHEAVAEYLIARGKLNRAAELTVRKLSEPTWQVLQSTVRRDHRAFTYNYQVDDQTVNRTLPVFVNGKYMLVGRTNHLNRTTMYLAPDIGQLQDQLGQELYSQGYLASPESLTVLETT